MISFPYSSNQNRVRLFFFSRVVAILSSKFEAVTLPHPYSIKSLYFTIQVLVRAIRNHVPEALNLRTDLPTLSEAAKQSFRKTVKESEVINRR